MAGKVEWDDVDLVIFDVDGTLYDQRRLRMRMALEFVKSLDVAAAATIFAYRRTREQLGDRGDADFLNRQFELVAAKLRIPVARVRRTVSEWIEERPLLHIAETKIAGVSEIFSALRSSGRRIAIFSDYPATEKLAALGLSADLVVSASDADVARLKPDPAGLRKILDVTGVPAARALMVGDRVERDGAAAMRLGVPCVLRSDRIGVPFPTFRTFADEVFAPVLRERPAMSHAWTCA